MEGIMSSERCVTVITLIIFVSLIVNNDEANLCKVL